MAYNCSVAQGSTIRIHDLHGGYSVLLIDLLHFRRHKYRILRNTFAATLVRVGCKFNVWDASALEVTGRIPVQNGGLVCVW
jgi:hypothetical protein